MAHFFQDFLDFFSELKENNSSEWFDKNRKRYETSVKKPFQEFVELMLERVNEIDPAVAIPSKDAIFRLNRDTRFSKDKRPYKEHAAAVISKYGRKDKGYPGLYLHLSSDQVYAGGGAYMVEPENLYKMRKGVMERHSEFQDAVNDSAFVARFGEIQGERNKVVPEEFREFAKTEPRVANKQFFFMAALSPEVITQPDLADVLMEHYRAAQPVNRFLQSCLPDR